MITTTTSKNKTKTKVFGILSGSKIIDAIKFERTQIHCFNDGFTAVVVVLA